MFSVNFLQKEEKIRLLRQRLVERESQMKTSEANGCGMTAAGSSNSHMQQQIPAATGATSTSLSVHTSATSSHLTPAATLAITQGKYIFKELKVFLELKEFLEK